MAKTDFIVDLSLLSGDEPVADIDEIRQFNPQRHEMEHLTGILYEDVDTLRCAGYKDVGHSEFWCRGHMPGMPVMPGVIQLEAVAQLSSFFAQKHDLLGAEMVGFGGVDSARFRDVVVPGDRLILMIRLTKARRGRMIVAEFQGVVGEKLVVDGTILGIPLPVQSVRDHLASRAAQNVL
ncbi:MAG: beta-hydroxyacyl-ACP dehydratase [Planctomycetales bacterium]|nr:beta-hydroxyacyl-ACP dehydratase [Planctomycetales bacterium]